ncbi:MAG: endopeptidase [Armatimonadota bacterium]
MSQIILGIPGHWQDRSEILQSIVANSGGFIFAGMVLMNTQTKQFYRIEIEEYNPKLQEVFRITGGGRIAPEVLDAIGKHRFKLYVSSEGVSVVEARDMVMVGKALLNSGGIAIYVESSGLAHSTEHWQEMARSKNWFDFYTAFVTLIGGEGCFYSCGMHNFGLPDCIVSDSLEAEEAAALMHQFNFFQLMEFPVLNSGETFSVDASSPHFRLKMLRDTNYAKEHPFHNPFGVWELKS